MEAVGMVAVGMVEAGIMEAVGMEVAGITVVAGMEAVDMASAYRAVGSASGLAADMAVVATVDMAPITAVTDRADITIPTITAAPASIATITATGITAVGTTIGSVPGATARWAGQGSASGLVMALASASVFGMLLGTGAIGLITTLITPK